MLFKRINYFILVLTLILQVGCNSKSEPLPKSNLSDGLPNSGWFDNDFSSEQILLSDVRHALTAQKDLQEIPELNFGFDPAISHIAITLFQDGQKSIRWISKRDTVLKTINRIVYKLSAHARFKDFDVANSDKCRIMLEVITEEQPLNISDLRATALDGRRFEPGITGFRLRYNGQSHFYMPTDAVVKSHLSIRHALNHITKRIGIAKETNKISKRIKKLLSLDIEWFSIYSVAFVTHGNEVIPLYRGYPYPMTFSSDRIREMAKKSVDWVYENMRDDGRFLYYYDGVKDTIIDHAHPTRTIENNYYNILRHSGGVITLLRMFEMTGDDKYLKAADKALEFLVSTIRKHEYAGQDACYVFYNEKAKLGGSGIGLAALLRYRQLTNDSKYDKYIHGLANHLLSRVTDDGEMIGYYIHPAFNNGNPIVSPTEDEKKALFSFYYPGEALMGLALYDQQMDLTAQKRDQVRSMSKKALDFLVDIRPIKYADLFQPLPSDGWLMQAIEEWAEVDEFRKKEYLDFVFNDAKQMISHMYNKDNSLYKDYKGTFFYNYGDHGYIDGARAEGLIAAYYLAKKVGREDLAEYFLENCKTVAESLMYSYNSEESTYMHKYPEKAIGTFRFKFTRHWVRVDTSQHTVCFFVRLLFVL